MRNVKMSLVVALFEVGSSFVCCGTVVESACEDCMMRLAGQSSG